MRSLFLGEIKKKRIKLHAGNLFKPLNLLICLLLFYILTTNCYNSLWKYTILSWLPNTNILKCSLKFLNAR